MRQTPTENPAERQEPLDAGYPRYSRRPGPRYAQWRLARWQDWANLVLGAWVFISPWVFGSAYSAGGANSWNSWITGVIIFLAAGWAIAQPRVIWPEWVNAVAGAWLFVSPWVLGFTGGTNTNFGGAWNDWIVGAVVFFLAIWAWFGLRLTSGTTRQRGHGYPPRDRAPLAQ